jgi:hypothetical protein
VIRGITSGCTCHPASRGAGEPQGVSSLLNYRPVADPWIGLPPAERGPSIIGRPAR